MASPTTAEIDFNILVKLLQRPSPLINILGRRTLWSHHSDTGVTVTDKLGQLAHQRAIKQPLIPCKKKHYWWSVRRKEKKERFKLLCQLWIYSFREIVHALQMCANTFLPPAASALFVTLIFTVSALCCMFINLNGESAGLCKQIRKQRHFSKDGSLQLNVSTYKNSQTLWKFRKYKCKL